MSNEIKVGDKVRVREDAPKIYIKAVFPNLVSSNMEVTEIEDECARIKPLISKGAYLTFEFIIPLKYLIKVEEEKKEPKFKRGDKVVFKCSDGDVIQTIHSCRYDEIMKDWVYNFVEGGAFFDDGFFEPYTEPSAPEIKTGDRVRNIERGLIGVVDKIVYGNIVWVNGVDGKRYHWKSDELELVEPTEQTEAEKKPYDGISEGTANKLSDMLEDYCNAMRAISDNFDWQRYAADLAKEIAVKVANKFSDPKEAGEYAVSVAKVVVEGLKRK